MKKEIFKSLSLENIQKSLNTEFIGKNIIYYKTTDSTNLQAKIHFNEPDGTVFISEHQTEGRGRLSRSWHSLPNTGIYMSILLKPEPLPLNISAITLILGLSAAVSIEKISNSPVFIKWPNDIVINSKKVCGILTELTGKKNSYIVAGIGINVNTPNFPESLKETATSIDLENNMQIDREALFSELLHEFEKNYKIFLKKGFGAFRDEYEKKCITLNRELEIITPLESYKAKGVSIDTSGALMIEKDGEIKSISSGEVSVRGIYGYI